MRSRLRPSHFIQTGLPPVEQLLAEGGDHRILIDPRTGLNRYQCPPAPDGELAAFGSSTASTISGVGLEAAQALAVQLTGELERSSAETVYQRRVEALRHELVRLCGLEGHRGLEVLLAPSGTDLHMLVAQLVGGDAARPVLAIIGEGTETGSGVPAALAGRNYSAITPFGVSVTEADPISGAASIEVVSVAARERDGGLRDEAVVDAEVTTLTMQAVQERRRVLLVVTDVSKTGLISPSLAVAEALSRQYPRWLDVLVDACQLRLSARTVCAYADLGWLIAVTGSKFLTGPAFSGALFIPRKLADRFKVRSLPNSLKAFSAEADWPAGWTAGGSLAPATNFGLLLRWEAALAELRRFTAIPEAAVAAFLDRFAETVRGSLSADPIFEPLAVRPLSRGGFPKGGWEDRTTIFPFLLKGADGTVLTPTQTCQVYELLRRDLRDRADSAQEKVRRPAAGLRVEVGQPVSCGAHDGAPVSALRLCASARLVAEACASPSATEAILLRAQLSLAKAAWLAREVSCGRVEG